MENVIAIRKEDHSAVLNFGGLTTDPEIRKLKERWPKSSLAEGVIVTYSDVESVIGAEWGSNRYNTITERWRKMLRNEHGIHLDPFVFGASYKVLDAHEKFVKQCRKMQEANRKERFSLRTYRDIDLNKLTPEERKQADFVAAKSAKRLAIGQMKSPHQLLPSV